MKGLIAAALLIGSATGAFAQFNSYGQTYGTGSNPSSHSVQGYTTSNGTYVGPHQQTNPNDTQFDNFNSRGNYNSSTGLYGTRSPRF